MIKKPAGSSFYFLIALFPVRTYVETVQIFYSFLVGKKNRWYDYFFKNHCR
jgi:hypothetical protein